MPQPFQGPGRCELQVNLPLEVIGLFWESFAEHILRQSHPEVGNLGL